MADTVEKLAVDLKDFPDLLLATSNKLSIPVGIVQKDYFVCLALRMLQKELPGAFIFKGGTSLSKGWQLVDRFSEDIDLLFRTSENGAALSKGALDKKLKKPEAILPASGKFARLQEGFASETGVHRTVHFEYPEIKGVENTLRRTVILEMGTRGGLHPSTAKLIAPYVYQVCDPVKLPAEDLAPFEVELLDITRTFVEKLFAVHAAYERNKALNRTRHYYDLAKLARTTQIKEFVSSPDYETVCGDVAKYSREFFPQAAIPAELLFSRSPAFAMPSDDFKAVEKNYTAEQETLVYGEKLALRQCLDLILSVLPKNN